jgi:hypothetical protein
MANNNTTTPSLGSMSDNQWWKSLGGEECPITLEPLSTLPYPPFALRSGQTISYFDGLALASYIVSRGMFQNPLTRQELTREDCLRLDDYLEEYCYTSNKKSQHQEPSRNNLSVAEAYALRESVKVQSPVRGGLQQQELERAQVLRSTATAALAGLFVYGNDRPGRNGGRRQGTNTNTRSTLQEQQPPSRAPDFGFDLSRTVVDSSEFAQEGWTVIDDDEALIVATEREAYQAIQDAFPRLLTTLPATPLEPMAVDTRFLEKIHAVAEQNQVQEARQAQLVEQARQQLLQAALHGREERKREQERQNGLGQKEWVQHQQDQEEVVRARAEIEAWREEQWERLRLLSEAKQKQERTLGVSKLKSEPEGVKSSNVETGAVGSIMLEDEISAQTKAKSAAKAAAKRKRTKERKKAQRTEEQEQKEKNQKEAELAATREASTVHCTACVQGILGCGFEKYGQQFCSPKCARTATPTPTR